MKHKLEYLFITILTCFVRLLRATYRVKIIDKSGQFINETTASPKVMAIWHNRLIFCPILIKRRLRRQYATIASLSDDGRYAEMFMRSFGLQVVRGSSSRGGARALIQLVRKLKKEKTPLAITIDGPRGPRYSCQPGAAYLAASTGCPVFPYVANADRYFQFNNWDKTQIPRPFAKIEVIIGEPIYFEKDVSEQAIENARQQIIKAMLNITIDKEQK